MSCCFVILADVAALSCTDPEPGSEMGERFHSVYNDSKDPSFTSGGEDNEIKEEIEGKDSNNDNNNNSNLDTGIGEFLLSLNKQHWLHH